MPFNILSTLAAIFRPGLLNVPSDKITLSELSNKPLIAISRWKNYFDTVMQNSGASLKYSIICGDNRTSYSLAKKGLGIAIVPFTGNKPNVSKSLDVKIISDEIACTDIYLIYDEKIKKNNSTIKFIDFATRRMK